MDTNLKLKLITIAYEIKAEILHTEQMTILFVKDWEDWEDAQKASEKHKLKIGLFEQYLNFPYNLVSELQAPIFGESSKFRSGDYTYRIALFQPNIE